MAVTLSSSSSSKVNRILNLRKPKTAKGRRILKEREPKVHEKTKKSLILKGSKSGPDVLKLLKELHDIRKPHDTLFSKAHEIHPFERVESLEKLCKKTESSLFCLGSKSKKRPFRVLFGRTFDAQVLDMVEFSVKNYISSDRFNERKPMLGSKPIVIFQGAAFDQHPRLKNSRSILLDFFRGPQAEKINLMNIDHAIVLSVVDAVSVDLPSVNLRHYRIDYKKSAEKLPHAHMTEIGPRADFCLDRERMADTETMKKALRVPKEAKAKKVKNVTTDALGRKRGRVHLERQDFDKIHTHLGHKSKKPKKSEEKGEDAAKEKKEHVTPKGA